MFLNRCPCELTPYAFHPVLVSGPALGPVVVTMTVLFTILLVGLLVLVDRARLTPVVRTRAFDHTLERFISDSVRRYADMN